jgi:hypothetical protein
VHLHQSRIPEPVGRGKVANLPADGSVTARLEDGVAEPGLATLQSGISSTYSVFTVEVWSSAIDRKGSRV